MKGYPKKGGRRMFGYEPDGVAFRAEEADAVRYAAKEIIAGRTLRSVARDLRERGVTSTMGNELTAGALRTILVNPRIAALSTWGPTDSHGYRLTSDRQIVGEGTWCAPGARCLGACAGDFD